MQLSRSEKTLLQFNRFIAGAMGLHFSEERLSELARKVAVASREFGFDDPEACMLWLMAAPLSQEQLETLALSLTIGETYFLRDRQSFRMLEENVLPELINRRRKGERYLRIWSAGCSTGEEPYSIAIILNRILADLDSWNITILATDINPRALEWGREGIFRQWSFRDTPPWLMEYFTKREDGRFEIVPKIRKMVRFGSLNLAEDSYPSLINNTNAIDIIFCRNVMLYFEPTMTRRIITRFHSVLQDAGWLFVGPAETAHQSFTGFSCERFEGALAYRKEKDTEKGAEDRPESVSHLTSATDKVPVGAVAAALPGQTPVVSLLSANGGLHRADGGKGMAITVGSSEPDSYSEAVGLFKDGHYELATVKIREFLVSHRANADALELLARTYANLGRFAEARQCCEEAIAADRLRAHNHYLLAIILEELGCLEEAATALGRTLYIDHDFLLAYFSLGNLNRQIGRKREAQRNFANALRLLEMRDPHEVLPEADGMTAGRLAEVIRQGGGL